MTRVTRQLRLLDACAACLALLACRRTKGRMLLYLAVKDLLHEVSQ